MKKITLVLISAVLLTGPVLDNPAIANGLAGKSGFSPFKKWRGIFMLQPGIEVPFNFEIAGKSQSDAHIYFLNGAERFDGGKVSWSKDSLFVKLEQFDNQLAFAIRENNKLEGVFRRQNSTSGGIPVRAESDQHFRFATTSASATRDVTGTYAVQLQKTDGTSEKAVGVLNQDGNRLTGTFLRVTGDSRFLEGIVEKDSFYLSSFIGMSPTFYRGKIDKTSGELVGEIVGSRSVQPFVAAPDESAALPDPYALTFLKKGYDRLSFSFPDATGKQVSPNDPLFQNKVVIISITGSWCPNCYDEASFLAPWYEKNKGRGVEVIALHYERMNDTAYAARVMNRFRDKLGIRYTQLFAGIADKQYVASSLPALNNFLSFPTTIFIDRKGNVSRIHTGYSGPATGKFYHQFVKEFNDEVDVLLQ